MSEEKGTPDIWYNVVKDADPVLYEAIGDALSPYLDVELVINLVASYTITMRRTYLSCAMKPSTSTGTQTKQSDADEYGEISFWYGCYRRLCVLVDDLHSSEKPKAVYFKVVCHDEREETRKASEINGKRPALLTLTRPAFENSKFFDSHLGNISLDAADVVIATQDGLPFRSFENHIDPPRYPVADPLELWLACKDPSTVSIEVVLVYEKRDLEPQYSQYVELNWDNGSEIRARTKKIRKATRDMILDECSNPVDLASIQDGEEVKSKVVELAILHQFNRNHVMPGCWFTMVRHRKNPRWKWVEEVVDAFEPQQHLIYEKAQANMCTHA